MPTLETHNASLFYETQGEKGPWITLVNGHTRSSRDFRMLARTLVAAGFQCLCFDNRGAGQTIVRSPFTYRDMVQDIFSLWDQFGIKLSYLVGISMGGLISEIVAAERPQALSGLILISTGASEKDLNPLSFGRWGATLEAVLSRLNHYFTPDFVARNQLLIEAMGKQILQAVLTADFEERAAAQRQALQGIDNSARLAAIGCPTLILHGDRDQIIRVEGAYELQQKIKNAELKILEGKGHLLLAEDSKSLGSEIIDFCNKVRP